MLYHNGERVAEMKTGGGFLETMCFFDTELFTWDGLPTIESLKDPPRNTMRVEWVRAWKLMKAENESARLNAPERGSTPRE